MEDNVVKKVIMSKIEDANGSLFGLAFLCVYGAVIVGLGFLVAYSALALNVKLLGVAIALLSALGVAVVFRKGRHELQEKHYWLRVKKQAESLSNSSSLSEPEFVDKLNRLLVKDREVLKW